MDAVISSGNDDELTPKSRAFAETLGRLGVEVDSLFFEENHTPPLGHVYQFNLDIEEGRLALGRSVKFLKAGASEAKGKIVLIP